MAFNPESACKALENRLKTAERELDDLQKLVRTLVESRNDSRLDALEKTLRTLAAIDYADKSFVNKLWMDYSKESEAETQREEKQRQAESDKIGAQIRADMEKQIAEAKAQQDKALAEAMKAILEGRIAKLEAQVAALTKK